MFWVFLVKKMENVRSVIFVNVEIFCNEKGWWWGVCFKSRRISIHHCSPSGSITYFYLRLYVERIDKFSLGRKYMYSAVDR
jgi:hypothetical protein